MAAGRHREFDKQQALHQAMLTFWNKGYLGASLSELTQNMGINKPSLYAAFGNKEALFLAAVDYYLQRYAEQQTAHLRNKSLPLPQRLQGFLRAVIDMQFDSTLPKGCLVSLCSSEAKGGNIPATAVEKIHQVRSASERYLQEFFTQAQREKELNSNFDAKGYGKAIALMIHGSAVMSKNNAKKEEVLASIELLVAGMNLQP